MAIRTVDKPAVSALPRAAERIRASARELFYKVGIRAVGIDEIVTRAGVTKPSLYRSFASKDALAVAYLEDYATLLWARFDDAVSRHPGDPRAQILAFLSGLGERASVPGYRGCGLTNAVVEYPEPGHPARHVAEAAKHELRTRLRAMARAMGAADADTLGDGLFLLIEGCYGAGQLFQGDGPARAAGVTADRLIAISLAVDAQVTPTAD